MTPYVQLMIGVSCISMLLAFFMTRRYWDYTHRKRASFLFLSSWLMMVGAVMHVARQDENDVTTTVVIDSKLPRDIKQMMATTRN